MVIFYVTETLFSARPHRVHKILFHIKLNSISAYLKNPNIEKQIDFDYD